MRIYQSLKTLNVEFEDAGLFLFFRKLLFENFSKVLGRKNKILAFYDEAELIQRRYLLKLLSKKYEKLTGQALVNPDEAGRKTFKFSLAEKDALRPLLFIDLGFAGQKMLFKLSSHEGKFVAYLKNYFKDHPAEYDPALRVLSITWLGEGSGGLFERFTGLSEHLKYCVDFRLRRAEYEDFRAKILETEEKNEKEWKFKALAKLFANYFEALECSPKAELAQIRQKYLVLAKLYHPDATAKASPSEQAKYREQFEKIQIAYDNLKALYKHNR